MKVKAIQEEDFTNYKECSLFIGTSFCDFKCQKENPECKCQNSSLAIAPIKEVSVDSIIKQFDSDIFTKAIVFGGLEPMLQIDELLDFIKVFRVNHSNTIVIYTGYYESEIEEQLAKLRKFQNIIIKFGRFIPNQEKHFDEVLGVYLASDNQYAKKIS